MIEYSLMSRFYGPMNKPKLRFENIANITALKKNIHVKY